jgi:CRP/FNR family cyclic AMP-dependent transcriptional regulator
MKDGPKAISGSVFASVPIFSALGSKELDAVAKAGKQQSYDAGKAIVEQGATGVGFFFILDGDVEVRQKGKTLAKLGKGQFFGEMALIDGQPRTADVVAVRPTECFALSAWSFASLVKTEPKIALGVMKELVRRLRETDRILTQ